MSYCLNPNCPKPKGQPESRFCLSCGTKLLIKDRYRALEPIGQGGFGKTFMAIDEDKPSKPKCVIKQFLPQAQGTKTIEKAAQMFEQEAMRLDELGLHPQIPNLLAYCTQDDRQYLIQEFIKGKNLAREIEEVGLFSEAKIRALLGDILPVLSFVHQHQVIHRDLKPENIIRRNQDNLLFLVDFGASKVMSPQTLAQAGTTIGSAGFIAPEQAIGRATYASDLYGLGATCINLLTGLHPFDLFDGNEGRWIWRKFLGVQVTDGLSQIIDKMLQDAISKRYQSAREILEDLNQLPPLLVNSAIDSELEQLQAQFLQRQKAPSVPILSQPTQPLNSPTPPPSQIDLELEEIMREFQNKNQKNV